MLNLVRCGVKPESIWSDRALELLFVANLRHAEVWIDRAKQLLIVEIRDPVQASSMSSVSSLFARRARPIVGRQWTPKPKPP